MILVTTAWLVSVAFWAKRAESTVIRDFSSQWLKAVTILRISSWFDRFSWKNDDFLEENGFLSMPLNKVKFSLFSVIFSQIWWFFLEKSQFAHLDPRGNLFLAQIREQSRRETGSTRFVHISAFLKFFQCRIGGIVTEISEFRFDESGEVFDLENKKFESKKWIFQKINKNSGRKIEMSEKWIYLEIFIQKNFKYIFFFKKTSEKKEYFQKIFFIKKTCFLIVSRFNCLRKNSNFHFSNGPDVFLKLFPN